MLSPFPWLLFLELYTLYVLAGWFTALVLGEKNAGNPIAMVFTVKMQIDMGFPPVEPQSRGCH